MPGLSYTYIESPEDLEAFAGALAGQPTAPVAVDTETTSLDPLAEGSRLLLLQIGLAAGSVYVINAAKLDLAPLQGVLDNGTTTIEADGSYTYTGRLCILQNAKFDWKWLKVKAGIDLRRVYDTQLAELILVAGLYEQVRERRGKASLKALVAKYVGEQMDKTARLSFVGFQGNEFPQELLDYAAEDVPHLWTIMDAQKQEITKCGLAETARLEFGVVPFVGAMELAGISINAPDYRKVIAESRLELAKAERHCLSLVIEAGGYVDLFGESHLNLASSDQVKHVLKNQFGIETKSTEEKHLKKLGDHPFVKAILNHRDWDTQVNNFGEKIMERLHPVTGRIHAEFQQMGGDAGRFTCERPNLQQVPADPKYRKLFVPRPGNVFVDADWQAMEMRILAKISGDQILLQAFLEGRDLHSHTAATMYGLDYDQVVADHKSEKGSPERKRSKVLNFALCYGMGVPSLAEELKCSMEDAQEALERYFGAFPGVAAFLKRQEREGPRTLEVRSLGGRRRVFNAPRDRREVGSIQRKSKNTPMQGCLSGETRIFDRTRGYVPIKSLWGSVVEVWDGERFARASVEASGKKQLVKVTLWGGHYIECSPDHRFLVKNTSGTASWKTAGEINTQDRVVLTDTLPEWNIPLDIPAEPRSRVGNSKGTSLSMVTDHSELGEWLGRLASDGSVTLEGATLLVADHEESILLRLLGVCGRFGHVSRGYNVKPGYDRGIHRLTVCSRELSRQLRRVGVKNRIPDFVWGSRELLCGYLRGLFDGDGMAHADGPILTFGQGMKHLDWARQVQEALLLLGIRSRINAYEGGGSHRINLCVLKRDAQLFCARVGFMNPEKQAKALGVEAKYSIRKPNRVSALYGVAARVKSVEVTDEWVDMFDVMDSDTGKFMANGIVVHNSNGDAVKRAMTLLGNRLEWAAIFPGIVLTVHDEILVECPTDRAEETAQIVKDSMNQAAAYYLCEVPIITEVKIAPFWLK